jgi:hypothetical protein
MTVSRVVSYLEEVSLCSIQQLRAGCCALRLSLLDYWFAGGKGTKDRPVGFVNRREQLSAHENLFRPH